MRLLVCVPLALALTACDGGKSKSDAKSDDEAAAKPDAKSDGKADAKADAKEAGPPPKVERVPEAKPAPVFTRENITGEEAWGPLHMGLTHADVVKAFGEPHEKSKEYLQEANGEYIATWTYDKAGVQVDFTRLEGSKPEDAKVGGYTVQAPSELKSKHGIGIGSTRAEVEAKYGSLKDEEGLTDEERFIAGSVYGGEIFNFKDGKVTSVFVGAAAE